MSNLTTILRGVVVTLAAVAAMPSWGQEVAHNKEVAAENAAIENAEKAALEDAAAKKAAADPKTQEDKLGSPILDVGVDAAAVKQAERKRLSDRQPLYYTYPPAARYLRTRPYFYRSAVPNYYYGGAWPRGYRLGPFYIDPNVGNHF